MGAKVVWHIASSLDGFIAAAGGDVTGWVAGHSFPGVGPEASPDRFGAILAGRTWHDECATRPWSEVAPYHGGYDGPIFVLTHRPPAKSPLPVRFLNGSVTEAIETALHAAGGKDVCLFGSTIPTQAMAAGLLDEMVIHVLPILLGGGRRLHEHIGPPVRLTRLDAAPDAAVTLRLSPATPPAAT